MFYIDSDDCTGCGVCAENCPQEAITIQNDVAVIDQALCLQCGQCARVCPVSAVVAKVPAYAETIGGGDTMIARGFGLGLGLGRGLGRGAGRGMGMGFGFRSSSPPWPYVGRGRGGLPRCYYPGLAGGAGYTPYPTQLPAEEEVNSLKAESSAVKKNTWMTSRPELKTWKQNKR